MKVIVTRGFLLWFVCLWFGPVVMAADNTYGPLGDEDPFPLACIDFSGSWRADSGVSYRIDQKSCSWLRIEVAKGEHDSSVTTIVPDNVTRWIPGSARSGVVRYRWNSAKRGTSVETYRTFNLRKTRVVEFVTLEQVSPELVLESVFRKIEQLNPIDGPPVQEYAQVVFRREIPGGDNQQARPKRPNRNK